jgi:Spy/CpxP family protein refolding chaperone
MTKAVVLLSFLVAFAAGVTVSRSIEAPAPSDAPFKKCGGWLGAELGLTPDQQQQLRQIWSETVHRGGRDRDERRRQLYRERDEAIADLIRPEDRERYTEVVRTYSEKLSALDSEWRSSFQAAVDRTKQMLTPQQREKYEKILQRRQSERGSRGWHRERGQLPSPREQRGTSRPT